MINYKSLSLEALEKHAYEGDPIAQYHYAELLYEQQRAGKLTVSFIDGKSVDTADYAADVAASNGILMAYALKLENRTQNKKFNNGKPVRYNELSIEALEALANAGDDAAPFELATRYYYNHLNTLDVYKSSTEEICTQPMITVNGQSVGAIRYWIDRAIEVGSPFVGLMRSISYYKGLEDIDWDKLEVRLPSRLQMKALSFIVGGESERGINLMRNVAYMDEHYLDDYADYSGDVDAMRKAAELGYWKSAWKLAQRAYEQIKNDPSANTDTLKHTAFSYANFVYSYIPKTQKQIAGTGTYDPRVYENRVLERCCYSYRVTGCDEAPEDDALIVANAILAKCYVNGWGTQRNFNAAVAHYLKAVELGLSINDPDIYEFNEFFDKVSSGKPLTEEESYVASQNDLSKLIAQRKQQQNSGCGMFALIAVLAAGCPLLFSLMSNIIS